MSGDADVTKKFMAFAAAFTVIFGGSVGGFMFSAIDKVNQVDDNATAILENQKEISERLTVTSFKRYQLTDQLENGKAKLAYYESLETLTLTEQADVRYLTDSISRWQQKLGELEDE